MKISSIRNIKLSFDVLINDIMLLESGVSELRCYNVLAEGRATTNLISHFPINNILLIGN